MSERRLLRVAIGTAVIVLASPIWVPLWIIGYVWRSLGEAWIHWGGEP